MGFGVCQKCGGYWCSVGEYVNYCICKEETTMATEHFAISRAYMDKVKNLRKVAARFGKVAEAFHVGDASDIDFANAEAELQLAAESYVFEKNACRVPAQEPLDPGNPVLRAADAFNRSQMEPGDKK